VGEGTFYLHTYQLQTMNLKRLSKLICIEIIIRELVHSKYPTSELTEWSNHRIIVLEDCIRGIIQDIKSPLEESARIKAYRDAYADLYRTLNATREHILELQDNQAEHEPIIPILRHLSKLYDFFEKQAFRYATMNSSGEHRQLLSSLFADIAQCIKSLPRHILSNQLIDGCLEVMALSQQKPMEAFYDYNYFFLLFRVATTWDWHRKIGCFHGIERFVLYLNFNTERTINYFVEKIKKELEESPYSQQIRLLLDYQRWLAQISDCVNNPYFIPGVTIKKHLSNWIKTELKFRYEAPTVSEAIERKLPKSHVSPSNKVVCKLSGDQIAIVLRAADEVRMFESRSLNMVFKTLIPYIATENRLMLSPSSIRAKSYHPEHRDKRFVIDKLHQMIEKIKDY